MIAILLSLVVGSIVYLIAEYILIKRQEAAEAEEQRGIIREDGGNGGEWE